MSAAYGWFSEHLVHNSQLNELELTMLFSILIGFSLIAK